MIDTPLPDTKPSHHHLYNEVAGKSVERLAALSDGVFAFALTLLVLDLHVPLREGIGSEGDLGRALGAIAPRLIPYVMTFLTLGIFWIGQQAQLNFLVGSNRDLTWIHIGFLFVVTLMPFSTSLLAEFLTFRGALLVYWLNIVLLGGGLYATWAYSRKAGLVKPDVSEELQLATYRRIAIAQALYAFGAALCVFNTYWSIAFIVAVQLNFVIAPRIGWLWKI